MTMKRLCATVLLLLLSVCAFAVQKSGTIVYINGSKFYIHTVQPGETLYGLSKAYEVGEKVILQYNPSAGGGLKAGENVKIPFVTAVPEPKSERKLRRTFDSHTVAQGETLYAISRKYNISFAELAAVNGGADALGSLSPGQVLKIPAGKTTAVAQNDTRPASPARRVQAQAPARKSASSIAEYSVQNGETLWSISRKFNMKPMELLALNGMDQSTRVKVGDTVKVIRNK